MDINTFLFYVFSLVLVFASLKVVSARNPVHAVLYLILTFFQASMLWMLLGAEFLSITLVLVYVGAVMVLFLFVVMMMDIRIDGVKAGFWKNFSLAAVLGVLIALEMSAVLLKGFRTTDAVVVSVSSGSNTKDLGRLLYSAYVYPLQVAGAVLLVAMIAAIALTLRARKDSKYVDPADQVRVKASDRLRVVKVGPEASPLDY